MFRAVLLEARPEVPGSFFIAALYPSCWRPLRHPIVSCDPKTCVDYIVGLLFFRTIDRALGRPQACCPWMLNFREGRQTAPALSRWTSQHFFICANYVSDAKAVNAQGRNCHAGRKCDYFVLRHARFLILIAANIFCCHEKNKFNVLTVVLLGEYKMPRH